MTQQTVLVRYFAVLREQRGCPEEQVSISAGETVGALYARLFPAGAQGRMTVLFAVEREYVKADRVLSGGEEVAFIPPLGGG